MGKSTEPSPGRAACPLGLHALNCFCASAPCPIGDRLERRMDQLLAEAVQRHRQHTGIDVANSTFFRNVCRTAFLRSVPGHTPVEEELRGGLDSEDLYLATALAQGDPTAWDLFFARHGVQIEIACQKAGLGRNAIDEVAAELAFDLIVRDVLARFRGTGPLRMWIQRCAYFCALRTRPKHHVELPAELPSGGDDPAAAAERHEDRQRLDTALARLPDLERRALHHRFFEGRTFSDLARTLGKRFAAQGARLVAAGLDHLRRELDA
jgi:DNA-directed RNA polymerase specialized sigma24 family protein